MNNRLMVCPTENGQEIVMDKAFAQKARFFGSDEYEKLQKCRKDYPNASIRVRSIKKSAQERYKGLTYAFMKSYIRETVEADCLQAALDEFDDMILLSKCHSIRYSRIKAWFLETYPEVKEYGPFNREKACVEEHAPEAGYENELAS